MNVRTFLAAIAVVACWAGSSFAQTVVYQTYSPVVASYAAPAVVYRPLSGATYTNYYPSYAPAVTAYSPVVTTYSPVVTSYSPVVTSYSPVVTETYSPVVTAYSPVVTSYSPIVTYSPVVTAYSPVVTSYYAPTVVRSKVLYVPGQPVRNFFRARTP
ncbi:MAG TPA: hypothetical protein VMV10_26475 [Pirellulales bacterium]|nr:hypothetical protein [Pirellulales bacterium]